MRENADHNRIMHVANVQHCIRIRSLKRLARPELLKGLMLAMLLVSMEGSLALCNETSDPATVSARTRGHALAKAHCSECHAVDVDDPSPTSVNANTAFRQLHERFPIPMLEEAARSGQISGHDEMPGFDFSVSDIRDLLTYIDSFAPAGKRYIAR